MMMILLVSSSFVQDNKSKNTSVNDNTLVIKTKFPKIYKVIVNESNYLFKNDYTEQKENIDIQCLAFSIYVILVSVETPTIPKSVLTDIQIHAVKKYCKNFTMDTSCDQIINVFEKLDCTFSYLIVDWVSVMIEINEQIKIYKELNKAI